MARRSQPVELAPGWTKADEDEFQAILDCYSCTCGCGDLHYYSMSYGAQLDFNALRVRRQQYTKLLERKRDEGAKATLMTLFKPEQRKKYLKRNLVRFIGSNGGLFALDPRGYSGNIREYRKQGAVWKLERSWCGHLPFHQVSNPSLAEHHLAQFLLISTDEDRFKEIAL